MPDASRARTVRNREVSSEEIYHGRRNFLGFCLEVKSTHAAILGMQMWRGCSRKSLEIGFEISKHAGDQLTAENPLGIKTETALSALVDTALARIIWCRTFSRAGKNGLSTHWPPPSADALHCSSVS